MDPRGAAASAMLPSNRKRRFWHLYSAVCAFAFFTTFRLRLAAPALAAGDDEVPAAFTPKSTSFRCRFDRLGDPQVLSGLRTACR
jgi:hypothetical protein